MTKFFNITQPKLKLLRTNGIDFIIPSEVFDLLIISNDKPNENGSLTKIISGLHGGYHFEGYDPSTIFQNTPFDFVKRHTHYLSYLNLSPEEKYSYLTWLSKIEITSNKFALIFLYGIERKLYSSFDELNYRPALLTLLRFQTDRALLNGCLNALFFLHQKNKITFNEIWDNVYFCPVDYSLQLVRWWWDDIYLTCDIVLDIMLKMKLFDKREISKHIYSLLVNETNKIIIDKYDDIGIPFQNKFDINNCPPKEYFFYPLNHSLRQKKIGISIPNFLENQDFVDVIKFIYDKAKSTISKIKEENIYFGKRCIALDGHFCDSISEMIIDNWFHFHKIEHKRTPKYPRDAELNPNGYFKADWLVKGFYVEFFGLMNRDTYKQKVVLKEKLVQRYSLPYIFLYPDDLYHLKSNRNKLSILID